MEIIFLTKETLQYTPDLVDFLVNYFVPDLFQALFLRCASISFLIFLGNSEIFVGMRIFLAFE